jgi:hypothetical protein
VKKEHVLNNLLSNNLKQVKYRPFKIKLQLSPSFPKLLITRLHFVLVKEQQLIQLSDAKKNYRTSH